MLYYGAMDFPIFQLPFLGNRLLIAIVGIIHVLISHGCAIGGSILVVWLEHRFIKTGDSRLNDLAYRILRVLIILTTTLGALTGVGIWFTTAIVSPYGIGSLLRIFFWAWAIEWVIFIIELVLFLIYYLTWHKLEPHKHIKIGIAYIVFSYWTMIIIIGILGAMLTPGRWLINHRFWDGYLNATFLPQLASRTPMAVMLSCGFGLLISAFLRIDKDIRNYFHRLMGKWLIVSTIVFVISALFYYRALPAIPEIVKSIAFNTKSYEKYLAMSKLLIPVAGGLLCLAGFILFSFGSKIQRWTLLFPFLIMVVMVGQYERVREFVRKPYVIYNYMYSNGILVAEESFLSKKGILEVADWVKWQRTNEPSKEELGHRVFRIECSTCHTYNGVNGVFRKTRGWDEKTITSFISGYKHTHPYMPPFVGTPEECKALAFFIYNSEKKK